MTALIKIDKNGTKYWADYTCDRCGGQGSSDAWRYTGFTCYKCGGSGKLVEPRIWKEYTPEYEEKLAQRRARKLAKELAKKMEQAEELNKTFFEWNGFDENGRTWAVLGDTYSIKEELKELGCKWSNIIGWHADRELEGYDTVVITVDEMFDKDASGCYDIALWKLEPKDKVRKANEERASKASKSEYVGDEGDRISTRATLKNIAWYEGFRGTVWVYTFEDIWKNVFVWKTSSACEVQIGNKLRHVDIGQTVEMKGTVKEHTEYKGIKQTVLTRCKFSMLEG